jgi:hypothetical protein
MNGEGEEAGGRSGRAERPKRGGTKGYAPYGAIPNRLREGARGSEGGVPPRRGRSPAGLGGAG